jgi:hypothetical protein
LALFGDGSWVTGVTSASCVLPSGALAAGPCQETISFVRVNSRHDTLAAFGSLTVGRYEVHDDAGAYCLDAVWQPPAFVATTATKLYHGDAATGEIRRFAMNGRLEQVIRPGRRRIAASEIPRSAHQTSHCRGGVEPTVPPLLRAFQGMTADQDGNVWVRDYVPPWEQAPGRDRWLIIDSAGILRRAVRIPPISGSSLSPNIPAVIEAGRGYVLGHTTDSLGIPRVVLFRIHSRR